MIEQVKNYITKNGEKLSVLLEKKHSNFQTEWVQSGNVITFQVSIKGLRSPKIYRWEIEGDKIFSTNGGAITVTPELNKQNQKLEDKRSLVPVEQLRIYNYIKQYHLEEDNPIEVVLDNASKEFGLSQGEIEEIFIKVDKQLYID